MAEGDGDGNKDGGLLACCVGEGWCWCWCWWAGMTQPVAGVHVRMDLRRQEFRNTAMVMK